MFRLCFAKSSLTFSTLSLLILHVYFLNYVNCEYFDHPINGNGSGETPEHISSSDEESDTDSNPYSYYDLNNNNLNNNKDDFDLSDFHPDPGGLVYTFRNLPIKNTNNNKFVFSKFIENWEEEQKQRLENLRQQEQQEGTNDNKNLEQSLKNQEKEKSKYDYNNPDSYHWGEHYGIFSSPRKNPYPEEDVQEDAVYINGVKKQKTKVADDGVDLKVQLAIVGICFVVGILLASGFVLWKGLSNFQFSKYAESPTLQDPLLKHP